MRSIRLLAAGCILSIGTLASAGSVTFNNESGDFAGTGFGNNTNILTLATNNSTTWGQVYHSGGIDAVDGDAELAAGKSRTWSVADLTGLGITESTLGVVFNINEAGNPKNVTLHHFSIDFYNSAGALLDTAVFQPGPAIVLDEVGGGQGSAGWLFYITPPANFFDTTTNRIGMTVGTSGAGNHGLSSVSNGADNFFITKTDADYGPPVPIPLPAAVWAGLALMGGVITKRVINRRQNT